MTITFPRTFAELEAHGIRVITDAFDLARTQEVSPTLGGTAIIKDLSPAIWVARWRTQWLTGRALREMEGWLESMKDGLNYFMGSDTRQRSPFKFKSGFPFSPTLLTASGGAVTLQGFPSQTELVTGDYIAFDFDDGDGEKRALHRLLKGGKANGSGEVSVDVTPLVLEGWEEDAAVTMVEASAKFLLLPDQAAPESTAHMKRFSWAGMQVP